MLPFSLVASVIGGVTALVGFYLSLRWDVPLGPTDVAVVCVILAAISVAKAIRRW